MDLKHYFIMNIKRRFFLKTSVPALLPNLSVVFAEGSQPARLFLGQGTMAGEGTSSTILLQTRLTSSEQLDSKDDLPGTTGAVCFEWSSQADFKEAKRTEIQKASPERDFIVRAELTGLEPNKVYYYRALYGEVGGTLLQGPTCSFKTLQGGGVDERVQFIVGSCMNYNKFMHGRAGSAGNDAPITATKEDKVLGFPAFQSMLDLKPDFFIGTGDIVYYDNKLNMAESVEELRKCWHEQFRFPRMIQFFKEVPTYWSKDDHDFRYNESDNSSSRLPLSQTGIDMFTEQLPINDIDSEKPTYRTHRVSENLQIWITECRDYRSDNAMPDGPDKTIWGEEQELWLKETLKSSTAKWKILVSPTPMVGPDSAVKIDNHTNPNGFRHEAEEFFNWLKEEDISNFSVICGDRHWQYHSIHPNGVHEFACGALNDENSRLGIAPGHKKSSDPDALIEQKYTSKTALGGYLRVVAEDELVFEHYDSRGNMLYTTTL